MRRKRRNHSPEFKAKVALAACQGDLTMAELVKKFDVHANQVSDWKKPMTMSVRRSAHWLRISVSTTESAGTRV